MPGSSKTFSDAGQAKFLLWILELPIRDIDNHFLPRNSMMPIDAWLEIGKSIDNVGERLEAHIRSGITDGLLADIPQAVFALGHFWRGTTSTSCLVVATYSSDFHVKYWATLALGIAKDGRASSRLCELAGSDPDLNVRAQACTSLGNVPPTDLWHIWSQDGESHEEASGPRSIDRVQATLTQITQHDSHPFVRHQHDEAPRHPAACHALHQVARHRPCYHRRGVMG